MSVTAPAVLYESSPTSVASGQQRQVQGTADGKVVISGTITATPSAVGAGTAAAAGRVTLASDDPAVAALQIIDDWDETDRAKVNIVVGQAGVTAGAGAVAANTPRMTLASDDPAVTALQVIDDWDESDRAKVNLIVGQAGVAAGTGVSGVTVQRAVLADDGGPTTTHRLVSSAASTNLTNVKASAGTLYALKGYNAIGAIVYIKLYNKASPPVIADDTALITHTIPLPPLAAFALDWPLGRYFPTGIGYSLIGAAGGADAGTTAVAAGDILGLNVEYR